MPRPKRPQTERFHHVFSRATGGGAYFVDDTDRRTLIRLLEGTARRLEWKLHAFCLMTTHYHAVVETTEPNLSAGMQRVNSVYVMSFNQRWARFGTLVAGRFGSRTIDSEEYLEAVCDYVFYNPVRAELVTDPGDWPWSGGLALRSHVRGQTPDVAPADAAGVSEQT